MSAMTKPQRVRWSNAKERAETGIENAISDLAGTFSYCPPRPPFSEEGKQEECESLAADCISEAIGCLHGAMSRLAAASDHIDWERTKRIRNWPAIARRRLEECRASLPPELVALLDDKEIAP
jgi:hypothetical protein